MESQLEAGRAQSILDTRLGRQSDAEPNLARRTRPGEAIIRVFLLFCGVLSIFTTIGIVFVLGRESLLFFSSGAVDLVEFFTETRWQPQSGVFGILPLLSATITTSFVAMLVAIPLGLGGSDLSGRICASQRARNAQTHSGSSRRYSYRRLWLLCTDVHDPTAAGCFWSGYGADL